MLLCEAQTAKQHKYAEWVEIGLSDTIQCIMWRDGELHESTNDAHTSGHRIHPAAAHHCTLSNHPRSPSNTITARSLYPKQHRGLITAQFDFCERCWPTTEE